jgi:uncharacterized protein (TIGR00255 family)
MGQITSMTGFGSGSAEGEGVRVRAVLRSVNGRFLDLSLRCSSALQELEPRIRERVQGRLSRGKVTGTLDVEETDNASGLPELNAEVAAQYVQELRRLAEIGDTAPPSLEVLARLPGIFRAESQAPDLAQIEGLVLQAVDAALDDLEQMRVAEGATLENDLRTRLDLLTERIGAIETLAAGGRDEVRRRLREKVEALLRPGEVNEERLATEVVLIAERGDITEEVVRFRSHIDQFREALDKGGDVGRRFNFLLQELHREINTISSKSSDSAIIHHAVDVKEEVERLREQVQNLA